MVLAAASAPLCASSVPLVLEVQRLWSPAADAKRRCTAFRQKGGVHSQQQRRGGVLLRAAGDKGGAVIDRPSTLPGFDQSKETKKKKPPIYRVMLHNDNFNRREYVVQVLMKVIDGLTIDDAVNAMQEAHQNGLACVIACAQEDAERYCEGLRTNGLISSIEPVGPSD